MSDLERGRVEQETRDAAGRRSSADRARLWASLNKHLPSEARRAHGAAETEREPGLEQSGGRPGRPG